MPSLTRQDLRSVFCFIHELYGVTSLTQWVRYVLQSLHHLVPSDRASYNEVRFGSRNVVVMRWEPEESTLMQAVAQIFTQLVHQHPCKDLLQQRGHLAMRWSDMETLRSFQQTALYNEYYLRLRTKAQLAMAVAIDRSLSTPVVLSRSNGDFSERDKSMLDVLAPYLRQSYRQTQVLTGLLDRLAATERLIERAHTGLVEIGMRHRILWITPNVHQWLSLYWPSPRRGSDRLPDELVGWLKEVDHALNDAPNEPPAMHLRACREDATLTVRLLRYGARRLLVFEEQREGEKTERLMQAGLGRRESDVLLWVANGKSNEEIAAILGLSTRTVKKHLERIFQKLGVESRTAAVSQASDIMNRSS
jgi:DNA-binding CsgD family transcriptional regulator